MPGLDVFEPSAATTCDEAFGVTRVNQLFAALNDHDEQAVGALLPPDDVAWDFEIQPDILLTASSPGATAWASDIHATNHRDLGRIMEQFAGFHLVFTEPLRAGIQRFVAAEDASGDGAGVAEADDAYVTQLWN